MNKRRALGRDGEDIAARSYEADGYEVLDRNARCGRGEIDLILKRGRQVVFCEVKTRTSDLYGDPVEAVNGVKQTRLRRLAMMWLSQHRVAGATLRFDVVSILAGPGGTKVTRLEDAF